LTVIDEHRVCADARISIYEIEEYFDVELPEHPDYESLGGFLLSQAGNVPSEGDELHWNGLVFRVVEADVKRIITVEIEKRNAEGNFESESDELTL